MVLLVSDNRMINFFSVLTILAIVYGDDNCPPGYSNQDAKHCYRVYNTTKTKNAAASQCESDGGYLSALTNGFDNNYVYSLGKNASVASMWLGIECFNGDNNTCVNDDASKFGVYSNFFPGNPSVIGNCVYMSNKNPTGGSWLSFDCDNTLPFLCEFDYGSQCQSGYTKFNGSCFRVVVLATNEAEAELDCRRDCGHLASIQSDQENDFLTNLSASVIETSYLVRIGLKLSSNPDVDRWLDQSFEFYSNFGHRDIDIGSCYAISLVNRLVKKGQWSSDNCETIIPYICKTATGTCSSGSPTLSINECNIPKYLKTRYGTGTEYSPGYPNTFGYYNSCVYLITTTTGFVVEIFFPTLILDTYTTISLYNDMSDKKPFATINSNSGNTTYKSTENQMVLIVSRSTYSVGGLWELAYWPAERQTPTVYCKQGYYFYNANRLCYKVGSSAETRARANMNCQNDGGMLAVIPNNATNQFLMSRLTPSYECNYAYIGLFCNNTQLQGDTSGCTWDDGTPLIFNAFGNGNPVAGNSYIGMNGIMNNWYSVVPSYALCYICQMPLIIT